MQLIKQSEATAARRTIDIYMVDATDGFTEETGLTLTGTWKKNDGSFSACAGAFTEVATGWYRYAPTTGEIDTLGRAGLRVTAAGARTFNVTVLIVSFDPFDAVRLGLTALPNANAGANGGLPTGDGSGRVTLTPTTIQAIWDALTSALTTANSIGKLLVDNVNATLSSIVTAVGLKSTQSSVDTVASNVTRLLGLAGENMTLRNTTYDSNGNLTAGTIRIYDSAANAATDDGVTGLVASYAIANTATGENVTLSKTTKNP